MKVAIISSHTPALLRFRMDMMLFFKSIGHEVYALGNENEEKWEKFFAEIGIKYLQIKVNRNEVNPFNDIKTIFSIKKTLTKIKPDKIFLFQAKTVIYGSIAANSIGVTEVYPIIAGIGSVFTNNDIKTRIIRKTVIAEYRYALRKSPAVFFQNTDDKAVFQKYGIIKNQKTVLLHGSGVNTERFPVQPFPKQFAFLCVSRLIRDKGIYEYLEACKKIKEKYPSVRCMLVGEFDSNPTALKPGDLKSFTDNGIIEYFGEQEDVRPYLAQCSVFILPSYYREGTPKAVLEAMSTGRPVITTDSVGCRETVRDGENGFLVPVKDVDAICKCMEQFINNKHLTETMGAKGRQMAENIFNVRDVNKCIAETMGLR